MIWSETTSSDWRWCSGSPPLACPPHTENRWVRLNIWVESSSATTTRRFEVVGRANAATSLATRRRPVTLATGWPRTEQMATTQEPYLPVSHRPTLIRGIASAIPAITSTGILKHEMELGRGRPYRRHHDLYKNDVWSPTVLCGRVQPPPSPRSTSVYNMVFVSLGIVGAPTSDILPPRAP